MITFFLVILGFVLYGILKLHSPFSGALLAALMCAVTFYPLYQALHRLFPKLNPTIRAAITDVLVFIFFVTPVLFFVSLGCCRRIVGADRCAEAGRCNTRAVAGGRYFEFGALDGERALFSRQSLRHPPRGISRASRQWRQFGPRLFFLHGRLARQKRTGLLHRSFDYALRVIFHDS